MKSQRPLYHDQLTLISILALIKTMSAVRLDKSYSQYEPTQANWLNVKHKVGLKNEPLFPRFTTSLTQVNEHLVFELK
jgi:hypothetical protein